MKPTPTEVTYVIEDHLCKYCTGRILRAVLPKGTVTLGGNPQWRCASCGRTEVSLRPFCQCSRTDHAVYRFKCVVKDTPSGPTIPEGWRLASVHQELAVLKQIKKAE